MVRLSIAMRVSLCCYRSMLEETMCHRERYPPSLMAFI
jgi:hypothetical protein